MVDSTSMCIKNCIWQTPAIVNLSKRGQSFETYLPNFQNGSKIKKGVIFAVIMIHFFARSDILANMMMSGV